MNDLIDRQAAIDALARTAREKFNLSDEFNHYLAGLMDGEMAIERLPSAQPEIIKCINCKYYETGSDGVRYCFNHDDDILWQDDDFCSRAERRTDG